MKLANFQIKYLKGLAHHLSPSVYLGKNAITVPVLREIRTSLKSKELIKVKILADEKEAFNETVSALTEEIGSVLVQKIGRMAVFYQPADKSNPLVKAGKQIKLP